MYSVIIHHTDMDGWCSARICMMHLEEEYFEDEVKLFSWTHGKSTEEIEQFMKEHGNQVRQIFVVDLTLPDDFMSAHASKIRWIDHHKSTVMTDHPWRKDLQQDLSALTIPGYKDLQGNDAQQAAACELCWHAFFPKEEMPRCVRMAGRYDVWDLSDEVRFFHAYVQSREPNHLYSDRALEPWMRSIFTAEGFYVAMQEGEQAYRWKKLFDRIDSNHSAVKVKAFGKVIAVANNNAGYSQYFDGFVDRHDDIVGVLTFRYNFFHEAWKVSCYQTHDRGFDALEFIQNFKDVVGGIYSMGGHKGACGFSFRGDVRDLINCFELCNNDEQDEG